MLDEFLGSSLPIILTAIGGVVAYAVQKSIDRRANIVAMRREFYTEFLDTWVMRHTGRSSLEIEAQYSRLRLRLYVVSSDEVISRFFTISSYLDKIGKRALTNVEANELKGYLADMILAIRRDCYEKSDLHAGEVAKFMPLSGADSK